MQTKFVAEFASNHNQKLDRCVQFIDEAKSMGCWGAKFQLFKLNRLFAPEAFIVKPELLDRKNWELPREFVKTIAYESYRNGIALGFTPFDIESAEFIFDYVDFYKVASYNILDVKLLRRIAGFGKKIVISTGAATIDEISCAVNIMKQVNKRLNITLLHCVSAYPTPIEQCNLGTMDRLKLINSSIGWSDHSVNDAVIYNAVLKYNADMIEFHYDIESDKEDGVDRGKHTWRYRDMKKIIDTIKAAQLSDGFLPKMYQVESSEEAERVWRADPTDGLRPLLEERLKIRLDVMSAIENSIKNETN